MKIFGYIRDKDGNFENHKNKVIEFSKQMDFPIDEFICEKSSESYEDMTEIRKLLETETDFILLVSDTSDLFEDDYAKIELTKLMDRQNVFLIDVNYPNFDYKMLIDKYNKDNPFSFLANSIISSLENYTRQKSINECDDNFYNDMSGRLAGIWWSDHHYKNNPCKYDRESRYKDLYTRQCETDDGKDHSIGRYSCIAGHHVLFRFREVHNNKKPICFSKDIQNPMQSS